MNKLSQMARELVSIEKDLLMRISYVQDKLPKITFNGVTTTVGEPVDCYKLYTFEQVWGSTSGGFEGFGGQSMTTQRTYVFVPEGDIDDRCHVYFGGRYAYSPPLTERFMNDVRAESVKGVHSQDYCREESK